MMPILSEFFRGRPVLELLDLRSWSHLSWSHMMLSSSVGMFAAGYLTCFFQRRSQGGSTRLLADIAVCTAVSNVCFYSTRHGTGNALQFSLYNCFKEACSFWSSFSYRLLQPITTTVAREKWAMLKWNENKWKKKTRSVDRKRPGKCLSDFWPDVVRMVFPAMVWTPSRSALRLEVNISHDNNWTQRFRCGEIFRRSLRFYSASA